MTVPLALQNGRPLSVVVASRNAVKINAVAAALGQALPGAKHAITGADSESGVPDQPFGDEETLRGAYNRLAGLSAQPEHRGSLLAAIEGGIGWLPPAPQLSTASWAAQQHTRQQAQLAQQQQGQHAEPAQQAQQQQSHLTQQAQQAQQQQQQQYQRQLECFAWVVVQAPGGRCSHSRSAGFLLPSDVSELILKQGLELGAADDAVWGRVKSGQGSGTIGKLTGDLITRQAYYEHAVCMALVPLLNPALYPDYAPAAGALVVAQDASAAEQAASEAAGER